MKVQSCQIVNIKSTLVKQENREEGDTRAKNLSDNVHTKFYCHFITTDKHKKRDKETGSKPSDESPLLLNSKHRINPDLDRQENREEETLGSKNLVMDLPSCQIIIIIKILQEISMAHNPELKAGAQCAHRKRQNKLPIKQKQQTNKAHHSYHTMDNHTINKGKKEEKKRKETTAGEVYSPETTNCTNNVNINLYQH